MKGPYILFIMNILMREGSLVKDPYLIGKTPIHMALEVPTHVKKLYILRGDGELIESDVKGYHDR